MEEAIVVWDARINLRHSRRSIKSLSLHLNHFAGGKGLFGVHLDIPALHTLEFITLYSTFALEYDGELICY
jgi:hypothetical protein